MGRQGRQTAGGAGGGGGGEGLPRPYRGLGPSCRCPAMTHLSTAVWPRGCPARGKRPWSCTC